MRPRISLIYEPTDLLLASLLPMLIDPSGLIAPGPPKYSAATLLISLPCFLCNSLRINIPAA